MYKAIQNTRYSKDYIEKQIAELREKWKTAKESDRKLIEIRGKLLKRALEKYT